MHALTFQDTQFDIVDRTGQPWLRSFQIGSALGYKNPSADMAKLYDRNADEFTDRMTALVELDTAGGKQQVRIFSLRGAHLLGMLSRTAKAKEFRAWVLDVLEGINEPKMPTRKTQPKALPNGLSLNQQEAIKAMVKGRAETLPQNKQAGATIKLWSALKTKFGCSYKEIHPDFYTDAVSLVARLPLEGEYIEREPDAFASDSYRADAAKFALDYVQRLHRHIDDPANNPKPVYDKAEESRLAAGMAAGMLHSSRMLVTYGWDGKQHITPVPEGAAVMTPSQMLQYLAGPERFAVDADELLQFIQAATDRLQRMHTYQRTLLAS